MASDAHDPDQAQEAEGAYQYSLRSLLIVMTLVAIFCSLIYPSPRIVALITVSFLVAAVPAVLTIVLVYGPRYLRPFCIGALFPSGGICIGWMGSLPAYVIMPLISMPNLPMETDEERLARVLFVVADIVGSIAIGLLAMGVRWMIESRQKQRQPVSPLREETP